MLMESGDNISRVPRNHDFGGYRSPNRLVPRCHSLISICVIPCAI